ncbi:glycosyl transferase family 4 [Candidatus Woesearchaeota archaeon]|nr:glycosyl transferase family 4 [Candidatus Woesearchaeota archaeon]
MVQKILFIPLIISFLTTLIAIPFWIKRAKKAVLVGKDMHKLDKRQVAEIGGIPVIFGFILGLLSYIALSTFYFKNLSRSLEIMALLSAVLIIALMGLIDDILGWKIGLRQYQKPLFTLLGALPIIVINAGHSRMVLPFIGPVDFGLLYPFLLIPLGIVGASNGFNMIGGYNGLESGLGIIILSTLGFIAWKAGVSWMAVIALVMVFALLAFYFFNRYPSKIFPGNMLTYSVGALIACIAILVNTEKAALILFIPYFIELILKLRGKLQIESFATLDKEGNLIVPQKKLYGIEHLTILLLSKVKNKVTELNVVLSIYSFEIVLALVAVLIR